MRAEFEEPWTEREEARGAWRLGRRLYVLCVTERMQKPQGRHTGHQSSGHERLIRSIQRRVQVAG